MFKKVLVVLALIVIVFVGIVAIQPSDFRITRSAAMSAPPSAIFSQVNDFHKWEAWSPWMDLDPAAKTTYEGPSSGEGAIFRWAGNSNIGEGSQTIIESHPNDLIRIKLEFLKPFKGVNNTEFTFKPDGGKTLVTWSMSGKNNFISKAMSLIMNCDKMVGGKFEEGLANLKAVVEGAN